MVVEDVRDYILSKLFFPKVAMIDKPGIIISKTSAKYGGRESKKRIIFYFEDLFANLQSETIKKLGNKKTKDLWYKIGKDVGTRYMLLANVKKPPYFLLPEIIRYICSALSSAGLSVAKRVIYNKRKELLILRGENNIMCRKNGFGDVTAGLFSGIFSYLFGKNFEFKKTRCCYKDDYCEIIGSTIFKKKYIPNHLSLKPAKDYNRLNFPEKIKYSERFYSFSDFIKFKKIIIDNDEKFNFNNVILIPMEIGFAGLIYHNYKLTNKENILKKVVVKESKKIAKNLFSDVIDKETVEKLNAIKIKLCALGWGIPYYEIEKEKIIFNFVYPPINKYGHLFEAWILNGFLDYLLKEKCIITNINIDNKIPIIKITFKKLMPNLH